jgi:post-segregation antitoxin (ccd killing protein)
MRSEVYSWRLSGELKSDLEREARHRKVPVSAVLEKAVRDWLKNSEADAPDEEAQRRLHAGAAECFGALNGGDPLRSETARDAIRQRLKQRNGR